MHDFDTNLNNENSEISFQKKKKNGISVKTRKNTCLEKEWDISFVHYFGGVTKIYAIQKSSFVKLTTATIKKTDRNNSKNDIN